MGEKGRRVRQAGGGGFEALRAEAVRQLKERLAGGEMSTGDLMKVITMTMPEREAAEEPRGDWVLSLKEDD